MTTVGKDPSTAVRLGLVKATPEGTLGRTGKPKSHVFDTRGAGTNLPLRTHLIEEMALFVRSRCPNVTITGLAKSGITWGAWLAQNLSLPYATVLIDGARSSGLKREVEGDIRGASVLIIDNWVRSGDSMIKGVEVVSAAGASAVSALVLVAHDEAVIPILPKEAFCLYRESTLVELFEQFKHT